MLILYTACSILPGNTSPGQGVTLRMARSSWDTGWFQAQIFHELLQELGYEVREIETLDAIEFYFFAAGGEIDFWANDWFPLHQSYLEFERVAGNVKPVGFQVEQGALQGYMIDKVTAEKWGITNMADFRNPSIAQFFDHDGDGKADLIGCNPGWGCARIIDHYPASYGLGENVKQVQGNYSELMWDTIERYEQGEPIFYYTWTPNWTVAELQVGKDVKWLNVPFSSLPGEPGVDTEVTGMTGCFESPCNTGFGVNDIRFVANTNFLADNPAAVKRYELVSIPLEDIAAENALMAAG